MVFNSLQPTPFLSRLTMRGIVSGLLSAAHSDYRSLDKRFTTIKTMSLLSAVCPTLIELPDWFSAERGVCPAPAARQAQPFANLEMAGASRALPLCNPDSLSASWTAQPERCMVLQPCTPQETWLRARHSPMPAGAEASAAVWTSSSTRAHL